MYDWEDMNKSLKMITGVVETGLFVKMAEKAYFGMADGTVATLNEGRCLYYCHKSYNKYIIFFNLFQTLCTVL